MKVFSRNDIGWEEGKAEVVNPGILGGNKDKASQQGICSTNYVTTNEQLQPIEKIDANNYKR